MQTSPSLQAQQRTERSLLAICVLPLARQGPAAARVPSRLPGWLGRAGASPASVPVRGHRHGPCGGTGLPRHPITIAPHHAGAQKGQPGVSSLRHGCESRSPPTVLLGLASPARTRVAPRGRLRERGGGSRRPRQLGARGAQVAGGTHDVVCGPSFLPSFPALIARSDDQASLQ